MPDKEGSAVEEMGEGGQKAQVSSYKMSSGDIVYNMGNLVNFTVLYIWKSAKSVGFKGKIYFLS